MSTYSLDDNFVDSTPGWRNLLIEHLATLPPIHDSSLPVCRREESAQATRSQLAEVIPEQMDLAYAKFHFWMFLLGTFLPSIIEPIPQRYGIDKAIERLVDLRRMKESGQPAHTKDWDALDAMMLNSERALQRSSPNADNRSLAYILQAVRYAALKNTDEAVAHATRETINAMVTIQKKPPEDEDNRRKIQQMPFKEAYAEFTGQLTGYFKGVPHQRPVPIWKTEFGKSRRKL